MKFVVLLLIVLAVVWFIQAKGKRAAPSASQQRPQRGAPPGLPQDMVECPVCLVHLPRSEALPGPNGQLYCCSEHAAKSGA